MFLHLSVSHSVHRVGTAPLHAGIHPLGRHPPGHTPPRQTLSWADTPLGRHPSDQIPPGTDTPQADPSL